MLKVYMKHQRKYLVIINGYAPTMSNSEKTPETSEVFYNQLEEIVRSINNSDLLLVTGDYIAKTGSSTFDYPDTMGKYGKGKTNSNGEELLHFATRSNLILTNTMFKHKR